ncbi:MAG: hypothetical protein K6A82_07905 [Prevotella sp.]|nr:hypothetical protein [Prevotella sp.]
MYTIKRKQPLVISLLLILATAILNYSCSKDDDNEEKALEVKQTCEIDGSLNDATIDVKEANTENTDRFSVVLSHPVPDATQSMKWDIRLMTTPDSTVTLHVYLPQVKAAHFDNSKGAYTPTSNKCSVEVNYASKKPARIYTPAKSYPEAALISKMTFITRYISATQDSKPVIEEEYMYKLNGMVNGDFRSEDEAHCKMTLKLSFNLLIPVNY